MDKYLVKVGATNAPSIATTSANNPGKIYFDTVNKRIYLGGAQYGFGQISWGGSRMVQ